MLYSLDSFSAVFISVHCNAQNLLLISLRHKFAQNTVHSVICWKLPTCCRLVSDTANKSTTSWQQVVVMDFGKWHDTTDAVDCLLRELVRDLLRTCRLCRGLVADLTYYWGSRQLVTNFLWTKCCKSIATFCPQKVRQNVVMDFGLNPARLRCVVH